MSPFSFRGSVHQNFVDFTFATGKIIGYIFTLKGEIDSNVAMGLSNKASLAFLQKHLGKKGIFFPDINQMILRKKLSKLCMSPVLTVPSWFTMEHCSQSI